MKAKPSSEKRSKEVIQKQFLDALSETGNITLSCETAKVGRQSVYRWRTDEPEFSDLWDQALKMGVDLLEDEAKRRAVSGTKKEVYQGGQLVGYVTEYSDSLLIALLKAHKPEKYKERHEHTGKDGGAIDFEITLNLK